MHDLILTSATGLLPGATPNEKTVRAIHVDRSRRILRLPYLTKFGSAV